MFLNNFSLQASVMSCALAASVTVCSDVKANAEPAIGANVSSKVEVGIDHSTIEARNKAAREVKAALDAVVPLLIGDRSDFERAERILVAARAASAQVSDPLRWQYARAVHHAAVMQGKSGALDTLLNEWAAIHMRGEGVLWKPHDHYQLEVRLSEIHLAGWRGEFEYSRGVLLALLDQLLSEARSNTPKARERLRYLIGLVGGQRLWHDEYARFAERLVQELGPNDVLSIRALLAASFCNRVVQQYAAAAALAERAMGLANAVTGEERARLLVSASSQLGLARMGQGRLLEAKPLLEFSRDEATRILPPETLSRAWVWYSTAHLYTQLGEFDAAIKEYERAVEIINERPRSPSLNIDSDEFDLDKRILKLWIGYVHALSGNEQGAVSLYDQAMSVPRMWLGYDPWVHVTYPTYAKLLAQRGRVDEADRLLAFGENRALNSSGPESIDAATIEAGRGRVRALESKTLNISAAKVRSDEHFAAALSVHLQDEGSFPLVETWFALAEALDRGDRDRDSTIFAYKLGAAELIAARMRAETAENSLDVGAGGYSLPLRRLAELLTAQGRLLEAEEILAQVAAEEQFVFARRSPSVPRSARRNGEDLSVSLGFTSSEKHVLREVDSVRVLSREHRAIVAEEQKRAFSGFALISGVKHVFPEAWHRSVENTRTAARQMLQRFDALDLNLAHASQAILRNTTLQAAGKLEPGVSTRVRYVVGRDHVFARITTLKRDFAITLDVATEQLMQSAARARTSMRHPDRDPLPAAQALWNQLILPVLQQVPNALRGRVRFDVDGALRYLPFAALHDGKKFLAERVVVLQGAVSRPHAARPTELAGDPAKVRMIALGAAAHDPKMQLPYVGEELASLSRAVKSVHVVERAQRDELMKAISERPHTLHIAAHFQFRPGNETRSALLLDRGERVDLASFRHADLSGIRLVTLSACDSALEFGDGAEVSGLANTLLSRGAESVLGTLWTVSDRATAAWMKRFYAYWRLNNATLSKVDAISRTQREFLRAARHSSSPDMARWSHPYYWAGYQLSGAP
jgi:CHAT domain-containing protein/tetratricopeptide (TPR) repeat protein